MQVGAEDFELVDESNRHKHTVFDVVIPLVGANFKYCSLTRVNPKATIHQAILAVLEEEKTSLKDFNQVNRYAQLTQPVHDARRLQEAARQA